MGSARTRTRNPESVESMQRTVNAGSRRGWRRLAALLRDHLLPSPCLACGQDTPHGAELCAGCAPELPANDHACRRCALPLPKHDGGGLCGRCLRRPPPCAWTIAPFLYAEPVDRWLLALKFGNDLAAGQLLGQLWARRAQSLLETGRVDLVLPMPLHAQRLRERGYNQVIELLRPVLRGSEVGLQRDWLRRVRPTLAQSGLSAGMRRRNLRGAFEADPRVAGQRVLLVDDVITTGSTVNEASRCLLAAGASEVGVLAVARVSRGAPRGR